MVWASVDGIRLPLLRGNWLRRDDPGGERVVTINGNVVDTRPHEGLAFVGRTKMLSKLQRDAYAGLLKGWGETWFFDDTFTKYSTKGTGPSVSFSPTLTGGPFDDTGYCTPSSGGSITFVTSLTRRFWVSIWRQESNADDGGASGISVGADAWHNYEIMGRAVATAVDASGDLYTFADDLSGLERARVWRDGVVGTFRVGHWFSVDGDGQIVVEGKTSKDTNATKNYSHIVARPFWGLEDWMASRAARTVRDGGLDNLLLEGDDLADNESRIVKAARTVDVEPMPGIVSVTDYFTGEVTEEMHGRRLAFELRDAVDASP